MGSAPSSPQVEHDRRGHDGGEDVRPSEPGVVKSVVEGDDEPVMGGKRGDAPARRKRREKSQTEIEKEKELSGWPLINYKCRRKERSYKKCVADFYVKEFVPGNSTNQEEFCGEKFEAYRQCVLKGIKKEIWDKQGMPPPKEGSPLAELDDEDDNNSNNDVGGKNEGNH